jgi:hypothetical protein
MGNYARKVIHIQITYHSKFYPGFHFLRGSQAKRLEYCKV